MAGVVDGRGLEQKLESSSSGPCPARSYRCGVKWTSRWLCLLRPGRRRGAHATAYAELYTLYIDPGFYAQGIGAALLKESERLMAEMGYERALLWCYDFNARARSFYERNGWACEGTLRSYEAGPHAIRYVRELTIESRHDA